MVEVCIFHKDGACLLHVPVSGAGQRSVDPNLISGFLSAISKFGEEIEEAKVKKVEFEGRTVFYEHVGDSIFAVKATDEWQEEAKRLLSELVFELGEEVKRRLEHWSGDVSEFESLRSRVNGVVSRIWMRGGKDMVEKFKRISERLGELRDVPGVKAVALISNRGFMIASTLPPDFDERVVSAISPSMMKMGMEGLKEMKLGKPKNMFIEGEEGILVLADVGGRAVLLIVTKPDANLGYIFLEMDNAAKELGKMLGES